MTTSPTRRALALLVIPVLLVLSGCKFHASTQIKDSSHVGMTVDVVAPKEFVSKTGMTKDQLCEGVKLAIGGAPEAYKPYDADQGLGCKAELTMTVAQFNTTSASEGAKITHTDHVWRLIVPKRDASQMGLEQFKNADFRWEITFPGEVTKHTRGEASGNKVTFTNLADVAEGGFQIESKEALVISKKWIAAGVAGAVLLAGALWWLLRRGKKSTATEVTGARRAQTSVDA